MTRLRISGRLPRRLAPRVATTIALALVLSAAAGTAPAFATSVSNVSVVPSTTAAGATGVAYTVDFTTSFSGGLVSPTGEITLTGPAGTFTGASFTVVDTSDNNRNLGAVVDSNNGTTVVLRISSSTATAPGDALQVRITNATNSSAGPHTFDVSTSSDTTPVTSPAYTLGADTTPPDAAIASGPPGSTSNPTATFVFSSSDPGATFACSVDGGPFSACSSPFSTPPLAAGPHTFNLRATDSAGNSTVVSHAWQVEPPTPTSTKLADLPPAVLGKVANVEAVKGKVFVAVPANAAGRGPARVAQKGLKFVPLEEARQIPIGSFLDTRKGTVALQSATTGGKSQLGRFTSGLFQVRQSRKRSAKGLTDLVLKGGRFGGCAATKPRGKRAQAALSRRALRRLRGNAKGRFRTRGRYSAATVRGTNWTVTDRCDNTLTKVTRGRVAVRDFRRKKTVIVRAGKSYIARATR